MPQPDVLPHGLKPKKKWEVQGPIKRANWKTVSDSIILNSNVNFNLSQFTKFFPTNLDCSTKDDC